MSFGGLLEASARRAPAAPALVWEEGGLAAGELHRRAAACAETLAARGVGPGDRLALALGNRAALAVALLAGWRLGATVAPLDVFLKPDDREAILADLAPRLLLAERDVAADGGRAGAAPPSTTRTTTGLGPPAPGSARGDAPALVLYTSGSTGRPKGAVLSHAALAFANRSWAGPVMALRPADVVLAVLPLAHAFGLNGALLAPLLAGARVVLVERFTPEAALDAIRRHRVTVFPGVATMFRRILDSGALAAADLASLRLCVSGAAPLAWDLAEEWRARTGVRILRGYGMTELFRPVSYLADDPTDLPGSVGRPVPGVEVRLVDADGRDVDAGAVGELWIRTPAAMDGYLAAPEETRAVLADGWFRTGDLARLLPGGFVAITGRERERILRGGYSVFPAEVEAVLLAHPDVAEAAVLGVPHAELGEEVTAFVALRPGAACDAETLIAHCRERLAGFKYPRRVTILPALPRSATGKILKAHLAGGTS
ncbi:MAG: hypothetical protein A3I14_13190 [Candidatus Rokubacteria bacterium RIFCSPLOWO2_02_FULL_73_56]|nr:MAG: hypothetical protein A3D33_09620 [Candidatus Rokubacteria bacterium RIFCSPHIGHO2_02_FULL_73_26]OGL10175.1 MAG: hypothetical protein A3I14_13190 [Candidatus Rokubacteria bacterium RIFCSPLOWO2_02_FULL_73_56]OGL28087.1 MAG: hypothetical protein A3G44_11210 [Candidatus Rokubacteria bacterium RIFCSPLOWO2_12_FULL_73_47]